MPLIPHVAILNLAVIHHFVVVVGKPVLITTFFILQSRDQKWELCKTTIVQLCTWSSNTITITLNISIRRGGNDEPVRPDALRNILKQWKMNNMLIHSKSKIWSQKQYAKNSPLTCVKLKGTPIVISLRKRCTWRHKWWRIKVTNLIIWRIDTDVEVRPLRLCLEIHFTLVTVPSPLTLSDKGVSWDPWCFFATRVKNVAFFTSFSVSQV